MATSESGHYINVANLNLLNTFIESHSAIYNPSNTTISFPNMKAMYLAGDTFIAQVQTSKNKYSLEVDNREIVFKGIKKFSTRCIANLSGTNVDAKTIEDAKTINAKIQATKTKKPKIDPNNPDAIDPSSKSHSTSRLSYNSICENIQDLVNLFSQAPNYDTLDEEFKIPALQDYVYRLKKANTNIDIATVEVKNDRIARDTFFYAPETGMVDIAIRSKKYLQGLFGASSLEFKAIQKIHFKNIR